MPYGWSRMFKKTNSNIIHNTYKIPKKHLLASNNKKCIGRIKHPTSNKLSTLEPLITVTSVQRDYWGSKNVPAEFMKIYQKWPPPNVQSATLKRSRKQLKVYVHLFWKCFSPGLKINFSFRSVKKSCAMCRA